MNEWTKRACQLNGIPSVPHSGRLLSQGGSRDGAQIGGAGCQTVSPSVTWGGSLSLPPKAVFFQINGSVQVGAWAEGLETESAFLSLCSRRIQNVGAKVAFIFAMCCQAAVQL